MERREGYGVVVGFRGVRNGVGGGRRNCLYLGRET